MRFLILCLVLCSTAASSQTIRYVDSAVQTSGSGASWAAAYKTVQEAITAAAADGTIAQIQVAKGTYYPTTTIAGCSNCGTDVRNYTFTLPRNNLALYGGYPAGGGTRNVAANKTVLSGDIDGTTGLSGGDAFHVVYSNGLNSSAVLDGFTITGGYGNVYSSVTASGGSVGKYAGAGMYNQSSSPTVTSCTFTGNATNAGYFFSFGAGMYNRSSSPTVTSCSFSGNAVAGGHGGGMYNTYSSPVVTSCTFSNNTVSAGFNCFGGGMSNENSSPTITSCTFAANLLNGTSGNYGGGIYNSYSSPAVTACFFLSNSVSGGSGGGVYNQSSYPTLASCVFSGNAAGGGGGLYNSYSSPTVASCTFSGNSANQGGGVYGSGSSGTPSNPSVRNTIFWGNTASAGSSIYNGANAAPAVTYSLVQGGYTGTGNLSADPLFVNAATPAGADGIPGTSDDGLRLQTTSPAIGAGSNALVAAGISADATGAPRVQGDSVDMGAYESPACFANAATNLYVDSAVTIAGNGASWAGAYKELRYALAVARQCPAVDTIFVAKGTYLPEGARDSAFLIARNGLKLYGGFPTGGGVRDAAANKTTLSGDIGVAGQRGDNSYHVLVIANIPAGAATDSVVVDGFTVTGGYATGAGSRAYNGITSNQNEGAGIYIHTANAAGGKIAIRACVLTNNTASAYGGGLYCQASSPFVSGCTFSADTVLGGGGGGGLFAFNYSAPVVTGCTFSANSAPNGGGLYALSTSNVQVSASTFTGNRGDYGGATSENVSFPVFTGCTFANNVSYSGGAMYGVGGKASFLRCVFTGNSAVLAGGAARMYVGDPSFTAVACAFDGNYAAGNDGGALSLVMGTGVDSVVSCLFSRNRAAGTTGKGGGAITQEGGTGTFIASNTFYADTAGTNSGAIRFMAGGSARYLYNNIFHKSYNGTDTTSVSYEAGTTLTGGSNNLFAPNPLFADDVNLAGQDGLFGTADDGLRLRYGSPALNAGLGSAVPAGYTTDLAGAARVQNGTVDIGAYEGANCPVSTTLYVDSAVTASGNGASWGGAMKTVQEALAFAVTCTSITQIQVAKGTHYPSAYPVGCANCSDPRDYAFTLPRNNLTISGGYPTGGGARNVTANRTILSGDLGTLGTASDNAYHVVFSSGLNSTAVLDGLTISGGNGNANSAVTINSSGFYRNTGGGMTGQSSSPTVVSCTFSGNYSDYGGGMANIISSSPIVRDCIFSGNNGANGGGMHNSATAPQVINCVFIGNNATSLGGGGMDNTGAAPVVSNCVFTGNSASNGTFYLVGNGGGMSVRAGSSPSITGCTFRGNSAATSGGAVRCDGSGSAPAIRNCIIWDNTAPTGGAISAANGGAPVISYSLVQGGYAGTGNFSADPLFAGATTPAGPDGLFGTADDGLRPAYCSPAVNSGDNTGVTGTDITGASRILGGTVDLGAYEREVPAASPATRAALLNTVSTATLVRTCDDAGWTYYALPASPDSVALAIAWGTATAARDAATVSTTTATSYTQQKNAAAGTWASRRSWNVALNGQTLSGTVGLRWYYAPADPTALKAAATASGFTPSAVRWVRTANGTTAYSSSLVQPTGTALYPTTPTATGSQNGLGYVQFENLTYLGGGTALVTGGSSTPLPVVLTAFDVRKDGTGRKALLRWEVGTEPGTDRYEVERSADAVSFGTAGVIPATGLHQYDYADAAPHSGTNYYRIRAVALDGSIYHTALRQLHFGVDGQPYAVTLLPNPAYQTTVVNTDAPQLQHSEGRVTNALGQDVARFVLVSGTATIDVAGWAPGVYVLHLADGRAVKLEKR